MTKMEGGERERERERLLGGDGEEVGRERWEREKKRLDERDMELEGEREGGKN